MKQLHNLTAYDVAQQIEKLYVSKESGTIYLMTDKNIMVQILITDGEIVSIHHLSHRGVEALTLIFESEKFALFDFSARKGGGGVVMMDTGLPPMAQMLTMIKKPRVHVKLRQPDIVKPSKTKGKMRQAGAITINEAAEVIVQESKKMVITEFTRYIGPMAAIVCEGYFEEVQKLSDLIRILDKIASEIGDEGQEKEFKRIVTEKIQKK